MANRTKTLIWILVLIIVILSAVMVYAFVVKPAFSGYATEKQLEGYNVGYQDAVLTIMQRATTCQPIPLTFNNQTVNLIAVECIQQAPQ